MVLKKNVQAVCSKLQACRAAGKSNDSNLVTQAWHSHDKPFTSDYATDTHKHTLMQISDTPSHHECVYHLYRTDVAQSHIESIIHIHVEEDINVAYVTGVFVWEKEGWTDGLFFNPVCPLLVSVFLFVSIACSIPLLSHMFSFIVFCFGCVGHCKLT